MKQQRGEVEVLLVEDNELTAIEFEQVLHAAHFSSTTRAGDGSQALQILRQSAPDLVITDLRMPVMGGYEFLQRLADQGYRGGIIIVSGVDQEMLQAVESGLAGSKLNILGIFSKPFDLQDLESAIQWVWPDA